MTQFTRKVNGEDTYFAEDVNELQEAIEQIRGNVLRYGGVGDGISDETAAIALAIDDVTSDTLYFPPGTYKGDGTTRHVIPEDVTLSAYGATLDDVLLSPRARSIIQGATFTGGGTTIYSNNATYDPNVTIRDCVFDGSVNGIYDDSNYIAADFMHSGWKILNNTFVDCSNYGIFSARCREWLIQGNMFTDCAAGGIHFFAGIRNQILNNTVDGGVVGIGFIYHRPAVAHYATASGNIISGNTIRGFSEEGISFDIRGGDGDLSGAFESDTVASTGTSGADFTVTMADAGWATHAANLYASYYCSFATGALAGRSFRIASMPVNTGRMVFAAATMTSAEHALIQAGDWVSIGMPHIGNVISNNRIDADGALSGHGTTSGIILYGNCFQCVVSGNVVEHGNIEINSIEGLAKPSNTVADNYPRATSLANAVTGNTVVRGDILFDHLGAGSYANNPTFISVGNVATGNVVLQGDIIADAMEVTAIGNAATYATSNGGSFVTGAA